MVSFGGKMISRLIIGSNTIAGGTHFSRMIDTDMRAWNTAEHLTQQFKRAQELGINCMEDGAQRIPRFNEENAGTMLFTTRGSASPNNTTAAGRSAAAIAKLGPVAIHHGGAGDTGTDAWWRQGKLSKVRDWCKAMKDGGLTAAVTSHRPEVFDQIESENWGADVDYYMCCLYKYGRTHAEWEKLFAANPGMAPVEIGYPAEGGSEVYGGEVSFVRGDPPEMLKIVKQTKKPCFVYKLLACGRNDEEPDAAGRPDPPALDGPEPRAEPDLLVLGLADASGQRPEGLEQGDEPRRGGASPPALDRVLTRTHGTDARPFAPAGPWLVGPGPMAPSAGLGIPFSAPSWARR